MVETLIPKQAMCFVTSELFFIPSPYSTDGDNRVPKIYTKTGDKGKLLCFYDNTADLLL